MFNISRKGRQIRRLVTIISICILLYYCFWPETANTAINNHAHHIEDDISANIGANNADENPENLEHLDKNIDDFLNESESGNDLRVLASDVKEEQSEQK